MGCAFSNKVLSYIMTVPNNVSLYLRMCLDVPYVLTFLAVRLRKGNCAQTAKNTTGSYLYEKY